MNHNSKPRVNPFTRPIHKMMITRQTIYAFLAFSLCFSVTLDAQFSSIHQDKGCYAYYPGNDLSGANQSAFRLPGTSLTSKGVTLANGQYGTPKAAYYFRSPSDHLVLPDFPQSPLQSVSLKFISDGLNPGTLIGTKKGGFQIGLTHNGKLDVRLTVSPQVAYSYPSDVSLVDGKWHHIVMTFSGDTFTVWLDGEQLFTDSKYADFSSVHFVSKDLFIGQLPGESTFFNGRIQDVLLYNRPLSPLEIKVLNLPLRPAFKPYLETGLLYQAGFDNSRVTNMATAKMNDTEGAYLFSGLMPGQNGSVDKSAKLNGHDDAITIPRVMDTAAFTISLDFSTVSTICAPLLLREAGELGVTINADSLDGTLSLVNAAGDFIANGRTIVTDGRWHKLTLVYRDSSAVLYLDGKKEISSSTVIPLRQAGSALYIGANTKVDTYFDGLIDNLMVWNRPLTRQETGELSKSGKPVPAYQYNCYELPRSNEKVIALANNGGQDIRVEVMGNDGKPVLKKSVLPQNSWKMETVTTTCPCGLLKTLVK